MRARTRHVLSTVAFGIFLSVGACRTCPSDSAAPAVPVDFVLSIGKGGGFTGQWSGMTIRASGAVWTWRGRGGPEDSTLAFVLPGSVVDSLWADVRASGILDDTTRQSGNLTARVRLWAEGRSVVISWPSSLEPGPGRTPLEAFYRRVENLALSNMKPN